MHWIERDQVRANQEAEDWRQAIEIAGELLVQGGFSLPQYVEAMIETVDKLGPYIVLAPGIALAHARPEQGCISTGFSAISLSSPVEFGNVDNDPVTLVIAFSSLDKSEHLDALAMLANVLSKPDLLHNVTSAINDETLMRILNGEH